MDGNTRMHPELSAYKERVPQLTLPKLSVFLQNTVRSLCQHPVTSQ